MQLLFSLQAAMPPTGHETLVAVALLTPQPLRPIHRVHPGAPTDRSFSVVWLAMGGIAHVLFWLNVHACFLSDPTYKKQNHNDQKHQSQAAGWKVAPVSAMWPARQRAEECQYQNHNQNGSKHVLFLTISGPRDLFRVRSNQCRVTHQCPTRNWVR